MSEYLSKKAVLEWLNDRRNKSPWAESFQDRLKFGAFDVPEMEHVNAYWAREGLIKQQQEEIQRLRAELKKTRDLAVRFGLVTAYMIAEKAFSTTTEPTNVAKVERVREIWNAPNANGSYHAGITKTLNALGITIPGINAPEGDGNDA